MMMSGVNGNSKSELPAGWNYKRLSDVADKVSLNKIKIKQKDYLPTGKYPVVDQGQELIGGYFDNKDLLVPSEPPYIIFGDHTKVKKFISFKFIPGADGVKVLKTKEGTDPKYLFYLLHTIRIDDKGYARHFQLIEKADFAIAPLNEQQQIVSKIEELFSELDKSIEQLKTAQQQLKAYRQSVLKWVFAGKLTNENVKDDELPKNWEWKTLSGVCEVKDGTHDTPKYVETGIPFVTQKNIRESGLTFDDIKYIALADHEKFYKRSNVAFGDILISMIGANRGMSCIVSDKRIFSIKNVGLIKSSSVIKPLYLLYFLKSPFAWNYIKSLSKGGAQEFVGLTELRKYPVIYCSIKEQEKVVQEIESRLSVADKLAETITNSLQQAEALRQSILKTAFEGKL